MIIRLQKSYPFKNISGFDHNYFMIKLNTNINQKKYSLRESNYDEEKNSKK